MSVDAQQPASTLVPPREALSPFEIGCGSFYVRQASNNKRTATDAKLEDLTFVKVTDTKHNAPKRPQTWLERKQADDLNTFFARRKWPLTPPVAGRGTLLYDLAGSSRYNMMTKSNAPKQKTAEWLKMRKRAVTGSKLPNALGFFGVDNMQDCWYETYDDQNPAYLQRLAERDAKFEELGQERMDWGTYHEIDGLATFLYYMGEDLDIVVDETTITPVHYPPHLMKVIRNTLDKHFPERKTKRDPDSEERIWNEAFRDTPDGVGIERRTGRKFALEIKASYGLRDPQPFEKAKWYYYPQAQQHGMTDPDIKHTYLVSWSPTFTRIWKIAKNVSFFEEALEPLACFHQSGLEGVVPTELFGGDAKMTKIKYDCEKRCKLAQLIGIFPSVFSQQRSSEIEEIVLRKEQANMLATSTTTSTTTTSVQPEAAVLPTAIVA